MHLKWLWMVGLIVTLSGCSGDKSSSTATKSSQRTTSTVASSSSAVSTRSSSTVSSTSSTSRSTSHAASKTSRLATLNQQLIQQFGQVALPQQDGLEQGSNQVNLWTQQQQQQLTVHYSVGQTPLKLNAAAVKQEVPYAQYQITHYTTAQQAQQKLPARLTLAGLPTIDLGHGLKGYADHGAGQYYLSWQEGRWQLTIHAVAIENQDPVPLAKQLVAYFTQHALPIPDKHGRVDLQVTAEPGDLSSSVVWTQGSNLYQVKARLPLTAIKMAVSVK